MTDTNPRELIQRLADALTNAIRIIYNEDGTQHISTAIPVLDEARLFLEQPDDDMQAAYDLGIKYCVDWLYNYPDTGMFPPSSEWLPKSYRKN